MKKLIIILGANGVGKSTAATELMHMLPNSAFVDSDSLRMMNPAGNSEELIQIQRANIIDVISNYLSSSVIDCVIFPYGIHGHRKQMLKDITQYIGNRFEIEIHTVVLTCSEEENIRRMMLDSRDVKRIKRAIEIYKPEYNDIDSLELDTTSLTPKETALAISEVLKINVSR